MKITRILTASLAVLVAAGLAWNQWRLNRAVQTMDRTSRATMAAENERFAARLREAEARFDEARTQLEITEQNLISANSRLAHLDGRLKQLESGRSRARTFPGADNSAEPPGLAEPTTNINRIKRAWGPEQAAGAPDTFEAGDISTAWASREQDAGEEWLKLDYENAIDVAEVRVRETHNPGAVSKITALVANGNEVVLWEGVEPPADAPVEMSFQIPSAVNAKSVKVYLDTARVPGWNEIDAVELIGRDGSRQWAKQSSASSTYAEPRAAREGDLERF